MEEKKTKSAEQEKLPYEDLKKIVADLSQRNQMLEHQLQNIDSTQYVLGMLFKVMDQRSAYDPEFVRMAKKSIQGIITSILSEPAEPEKKDENQ